MNLCDLSEGQKNALKERLEQSLSEARRTRIKEVVAGRTRTVIPVLEGIYDRGNVSAVMRSAEAFGFQDFHVIETSEKFKVANRVSQGADKWVDVVRWPQSSACIDFLKNNKYQIIATHLCPEAKSIESVDFSKPTALVFGNEHAGVSPEMLAAADGWVVVPMRGFVQSFNISVAAALCFQHIYYDRIKRQGYHGDLSASEQEELLLDFYCRSLPGQSELLLNQI